MTTAAAEREGRTWLAPAKVNLGLRIVGVRPDGYHRLESLFVPLDFGDRVTLRVTPNHAPEVILRITGGGPDVPDDARNLAHRAASQFLAAGSLATRVDISLAKTIPSGAGLGGGSSDAGTVLRALSELMPGAVPETSLAELALELGADVPFFLRPTPSEVRGIGEVIEPRPGIPSLALLLAHPGPSLSTPEVFRAFDALTPRPNPDPQQPPWPKDPSALRAQLENDLEPAAIRLCPSIARLREQIESLGASAVGMSGSGATIFGVFDSIAHANEAQQRAGFSAAAWSRVASTQESR